MASGSRLQFTVKVGALPEATFAVAEFTLLEQLSLPFILQLALASARAISKLKQPCELQVWFNGELPRRLVIPRVGHEVIVSFLGWTRTSPSSRAVPFMPPTDHLCPA